jgi:hypothetical protein
VSGLRLRHLTFIGSTVPTATVDFGERATIVRGPSDTGKSFIVDAIDFMFGARQLKEIPEREGYSDVLLGLELPDGDVVTLRRSTNGGRFGLYEADIRDGPLEQPPSTLGERHDARNTDNLSRYLLEKVGLDEKKVRKNQYNQTESLSFRNLAHLCIVDETTMQAETPPALTGVTTTKTREVSVLKLLLQNEDDSSLIAGNSPRDRNRLLNARTEVLDRLITEQEALIAEAASADELQSQLQRLANSIDQHTSAIDSLTSTRNAQATRLSDLGQQADSTRRQRMEAQALEARFQLLLAQYESDLQRLAMIGEAGSLLGYFTPGVCVFCGAEPEHQHLNEDCPEDTTHFAQSVESESAKTNALRADLLSTLAGLSDQLERLRGREASLRRAITDARGRVRQLDEALRPHQGGIQELLAMRSSVERLVAAYEQIVRLNSLKVELAAESQTEAATAAVGMEFGALREFSEQVAQRLDAWGFPAADNVRYDRNEQDLIAGDQLRSAHGKGVRAILHAAFTIGLANHCLAKEYPHPGFVVLDSPLVTYRPPEEGEEVPEDDRMAPSFAGKFYTDIQHAFDGQIIVMENMDPPEPLEPETGDVAFTGNPSHGRAGFFPPRSSRPGPADGQ